MIQGCRKQVERKEGYELQLVKAMAHDGLPMGQCHVSFEKSTTGYVTCSDRLGCECESDGV